jgi:Ribbon-helix-helix protein, copG family
MSKRGEQMAQDARDTGLGFIGAQVSGNQYEKLHDLAAQEQTSMATIIRRAIRSELERAEQDGQAAATTKGS